MGESAAPGRYREKVVAPRAAGRETLYLLLAVTLILAAMALRFTLLHRSAGARGPESYQLADVRLKNQAPALYRALLGSAMDILYLRSADGSWPDIDQLRQEGLPPFAAELLPTGLRGFVWEMHRRSGWVDYFGVDASVGSTRKNADPLKNSFLLRIIDLQSDDPPFPHCRKTTPERYDIQVWFNSRKTDYPASDPIKRGWKWIYGAGARDCERIVEGPG